MSLGLSKAGCGDANYAVIKYCAHTRLDRTLKMCMCVATSYVNNKVGVIKNPLWEFPETVVAPHLYSDHGSSFHVV